MNKHQARLFTVLPGCLSVCLVSPLPIQQVLEVKKKKSPLDKCVLTFWCCQRKPRLWSWRRGPHADCSVSKKSRRPGSQSEVCSWAPFLMSFLWKSNLQRSYPGRGSNTQIYIDIYRVRPLYRVRLIVFLRRCLKSKNTFHVIGRGYKGHTRTQHQLAALNYQLLVWWAGLCKLRCGGDESWQEPTGVPFIHRAAHQHFTVCAYHNNMYEMLWTKGKRKRKLLAGLLVLHENTTTRRESASEGAWQAPLNLWRKKKKTAS